MYHILLIFLALVVCISIHTGALALTGYLLGGKVEIVSLFLGPSLFGVKIGGTEFRLSALPMGGYVKYAEGFTDLHPLKRLAIAASGCLALLLAALVLLGLGGGWESFTNGFAQFVTGTLAPTTRGAQLLRALYGFAQSQPWTALLGLCAAKMAAYNLLPLPMLNGGEIILAFVEWLVPALRGMREKINLVGLCLMMVIMAAWAVALFYAVTGG